MAGENNTENVKINIHVSGKGKIKRTVQHGERERLLEGYSKAESSSDQVKRRNYYVKRENNTETIGTDIHVSGTVQDGETECLLGGNSEAESWIDQIRHKYESDEYKRRITSPHVSIYRVPESIKKTKRGAYDPLVVFLGPYHHKKHQQLTAMDEYKLQAVDRTLGRLGMKEPYELYAEVEKLKKEIKDCYEDSAIEWHDETLVWMMTMDACFILEFLRMDLPNSSLVFHSQRSNNIKRREIILDILKLENQIPLCILKNILELELKDPGAVPAFLAKQLNDCIGGYFQGYPFSHKENDKVIAELIEGVKSNENVLAKLSEALKENEKVIAKLIVGGAPHLLDLSRQVIVNFLSNSGSGSGSESAVHVKGCACNVDCGASTCIATRKGVACFRGANSTAVSRWLLPSSAVDESLIPSADKLQKAGIKLKLSTEGKFHFERRRCFRRSILFLPRLIVDYHTEIFLRNLVAFEECQRHDNSPVKRVISLNMCIMDNLIDSKEDVGLFQRANIIKSYLGTDDEVAQIFNDLCTGITYKDDFKEVLRNVNEHYNRKLNVWITEFCEEYCSRPWYILSVVAAVLLLVMTLLQTIYTMKGYFQS